MRTRSIAWLSIFCSFTVWAGQPFQQRVDHTIRVRLDDVKNELVAEQTITFHNNASVALDTIWFHLWPNAYNKKGTALCEQKDRNNDFALHFANDEDRGSLSGFAPAVNGTPLNWGEHVVHGDIAWVALSAPLAPGMSVIITTPFTVALPKGRYSRLGHTGQAYAITQWYPKPAVYDGDGWHAMPYLDNGEFYNDFGSYDVYIDIPKNYVIGATGVLQDEGERAWMDSLSRADHDLTQWPKDRKGRPSNEFPPTSSDRKVVHFIQDDVHDFAWFADKRFLVERSQVNIPSTGKTVETWALFTPRNAPLWKDSAVAFINASVLAYSEWVGAYPYASCTAVDGTISAGGGMEYPMITVIGNMSDHESLDNVIAHEVGHNWFQGMLASNERDHAWMDEGMNSAVELRYMRERYAKGTDAFGIPFTKRDVGRSTDPHRFVQEMSVLLNTRRNMHQVIEQTSVGFTEINYGTMVYSKTALLFDQLEAYLGRAVFDRCMHAYFDEFSMHHPGPDDVRKTFERESGKDLSWFFDEAFRTPHVFDVKARALKGNTFKFFSSTSQAMPFPVTGFQGKDTLGTVWCEGASGKGTCTLPWPDADRVRVDAHQRTLDVDRRNNTVRAHGLCKRSIPPAVRLLGLERGDRRTTYMIPLPAYNAHDGFMLGLAVLNTTFPSQRLEWALAPLYGFSSGTVVGGGRIMYHTDRLHSRFFENTHSGVSVMRASLGPIGDVQRSYFKIAPSFRIDLRADRAKRNTAHTIGLRSVVLQHYSEGTVEGEAFSAMREDIFHQLDYTVDRRIGLAPFHTGITITQHPAFTRGEVVSEHAFIYDRRAHRFTVRAFAGAFFRKDNAQMQREFGLRLHWGSADMLYDHLFIERQDLGRLTTQQFVPYQGGFKTPTSLGTSDTWIASTNMELDLPIPLPISLFFSAAITPITRITANGTETDTQSHYEGGIGIRIIRDVAEVWFPLVYSEGIKDQLDLLDLDFGERIRFVLALEALDPTKLLRRAPR